ncbi:hypothetical protein A5717_11195 [Mycolicibacterium porcinum]|nr:hypothetical protein A5717_11195 [Mycolicibacterium porcinum]
MPPVLSDHLLQKMPSSEPSGMIWVRLIGRYMSIPRASGGWLNREVRVRISSTMTITTPIATPR